jgi:predicted dehydrogenase
MKQIEVGLVGLGLVSRSHLKGYTTHPQAQVTAVCDTDAQKATRFAQEHGINQVYTSYEEMLAQADIDLVDIATPTFLHAPMALQAAHAGKHIHCEKPFCRSTGEGLEVCRAVKAHGVKLVVGETYVFLSSHTKARALIEAGAIGRPLQIRQRHGAWKARPDAAVYSGPEARNWRLDPQQSGGGDYPWIYDHAVHFFATAEYLSLDQRIATVHAITSSGQSIGQPTGQSGASHDPYTVPEVDIPIITWSCEDPAYQGVWMRAEPLNGKYDFMRGFSTTIIGETGMIEVLGEGGYNLLWNGAQQHLLLHRQDKETQSFRFDEGGDDIWDSEISYYSQGHVHQVHHLLDSIQHNTPPRYNGIDGVRAVQCTLAVIRSARENRPVGVAEIDPQYAAYD